MKKNKREWLNIIIATIMTIATIVVAISFTFIVVDPGKFFMGTILTTIIIIICIVVVSLIGGIWYNFYLLLPNKKQEKK